MILAAEVVKVLQDMADRLKGAPFAFYSWPQVWDNTSCGFGGGGQGMVESQTCVALSEDKDAHRLLVYHGGRYAYTIRDVNLEQWYLRQTDLPGRREAFLKGYIEGLGAVALTPGP